MRARVAADPVLLVANREKRYRRAAERQLEAQLVGDLPGTTETQVYLHSPAGLGE